MEGWRAQKKQDQGVCVCVVVANFILLFSTDRSCFPQVRSAALAFFSPSSPLFSLPFPARAGSATAPKPAACCMLFVELLASPLVCWDARPPSRRWSLVFCDSVRLVAQKLKGGVGGTGAREREKGESTRASLGRSRFWLPWQACPFVFTCALPCVPIVHFDRVLTRGGHAACMVLALFDDAAMTTASSC